MYEPRYFKEDEFKKLTPSCSIAQMDENLLEGLDELREAVDMPFIITSAYRSPDWDLAKGRTGQGPHTKGMAVDVSCPNSYFARRVLEEALKRPQYFKGIGIGKNFIHLDVMYRSFAPLVWGY